MNRYAIAHDKGGNYFAIPDSRPVPDDYHLDFYFLGHREAAWKAAEDEKKKAKRDGIPTSMLRTMGYAPRKKHIVYGRKMDEWDRQSEPA